MFKALSSALLACLLVMGFITDAKRTEATLDFSEASLTAEEQALVNESTAQIQEYLNETKVPIGHHASCPELEGENSLYKKKESPDEPNEMRNLAFVTIVHGDHLPSKYGLLDTIDPYVTFWVNDKEENKASTKVISNDEHPNWNWGCLFPFDGDSFTLGAEVWNSNYMMDRSIGSIARGDEEGITIDTKFMEDKAEKSPIAEWDKVLYDKFNKVKASNGERVAKLRLRVELIRHPGYESKKKSTVMKWMPSH